MEHVAQGEFNWLQVWEEADLVLIRDAREQLIEACTDPDGWMG
jgi:hypothetical protein